MPKLPKVAWDNEVHPKDFNSAKDYLSLKLNKEQTKEVIEALIDGKIVQRRADDILRATGLKPLPFTDPGVHCELLKLLRGSNPSPVLIVHFTEGADIADGYHRVSLAYALDPDTSVDCVIAEIGGVASNEIEPTTNS